MKNGLALFLGVFATLALSWAGLLLTAHRQIGGLSQHKDQADESLYPQALSGLANQGRLVYQDLGCVTCHTQQVRQEGFGHDVGEGSRKWGERGSYAYAAPSTMVSTVGVNVQAESDLKVELFGEVKINFASETLPLDRFANAAQIQLLESHAGRPAGGSLGRTAGAASTTAEATTPSAPPAATAPPAGEPS